MPVTVAAGNSSATVVVLVVTPMCIIFLDQGAILSTGVGSLEQRRGPDIF